MDRRILSIYSLYEYEIFESEPGESSKPGLAATDPGSEPVSLDSEPVSPDSESVSPDSESVLVDCGSKHE